MGRFLALNLVEGEACDVVSEVMERRFAESQSRVWSGNSPQERPKGPVCQTPLHSRGKQHLARALISGLFRDQFALQAWLKARPICCVELLVRVDAQERSAIFSPRRSFLSGREGYLTASDEEQIAGVEVKKYLEKRQEETVWYQGKRISVYPSATWCEEAAGVSLKGVIQGLRTLQQELEKSFQPQKVTAGRTETCAILLRSMLRCVIVCCIQPVGSIE